MAKKSSNTVDKIIAILDRYDHAVFITERYERDALKDAVKLAHMMSNRRELGSEYVIEQIDLLRDTHEEFVQAKETIIELESQVRSIRGNNNETG
jgi:hypothetical protein